MHGSMNIKPTLQVLMHFLKTPHLLNCKKNSPSTYGNLGFTLVFEYTLKQLSPAEKLATCYFIFVLILQEVSQLWETETI